MATFENLDWDWIISHYNQRVRTHQVLRQLLDGKLVTRFAELALGIEDGSGNYSANEHGLGPQILIGNVNSEQRVCELAKQFLLAETPSDIPPLILNARLKYLQISV